MWSFVLWLRDSISDIGHLLDNYSFSIAGMSVSILDLFIGLICMSIIITVFWKGAHS